MLNQWRGWAGGQFSQRNSCSSSYSILANFLKWQTALLVEIFQKADYWFHSTSPSEKEGLSLEGGRKGKAVTTARAGEASLGNQPKGWRGTSQALIWWWWWNVCVCESSKEIHPYISRISWFPPQSCRTQYSIIQFPIGGEWKCLPNPQTYRKWS